MPNRRSFPPPIQRSPLPRHNPTLILPRPLANASSPTHSGDGRGSLHPREFWCSLLRPPPSTQSPTYSCRSLVSFLPRFAIVTRNMSVAMRASYLSRSNISRRYRTRRTSAFLTSLPSFLWLVCIVRTSLLMGLVSYYYYQLPSGIRLSSTMPEHTSSRYNVLDRYVPDDLYADPSIALIFHSSRRQPLYCQQR